MIDLAPYKAIIFDFDDTLVATLESRSKSLMIVADRLGYSLNKETISQHWGKPFQDLISNLFPGVEYDKFLAHYQEAMRIVPPVAEKGANTILKRLKDKDAKIIIVSSGMTQLIWEDLQRAHLNQYVSQVYGSDMLSHHKPDPQTLDPILSHLATLGVSKPEVIYIGDSVVDYRLASDCGIPFVAVTTGQHSKKSFQRLGLSSIWIIDSLGELV